MKVYTLLAFVHKKLKFNREKGSVRIRLNRSKGQIHVLIRAWMGM